MYGLSDNELKIIQQVFAKYAQVEQAILFGSRAKGTHKPGSDVDIYLTGVGVNKIIAELAGVLNDESLLPYIIDLVCADEVTNIELTDHIQRVGKVIYQKFNS